MRLGVGGGCEKIDKEEIGVWVRIGWFVVVTNAGFGISSGGEIAGGGETNDTGEPTVAGGTLVLIAGLCDKLIL